MQYVAEMQMARRTPERNAESLLFISYVIH